MGAWVQKLRQGCFIEVRHACTTARTYLGYINGTITIIEMKKDPQFCNPISWGMIEPSDYDGIKSSFI